jgi:hypothetical protein
MVIIPCSGSLSMVIILCVLVPSPWSQYVLWFIFDLKYGCRRILQSHILERNLLSFLTGYPIVIAQVAFHQFLVPAATAAAEWGKTVYEFQLHLLHKVYHIISTT